MSSPYLKSSTYKNYSACALLFFIILIIYSNSFHSSWHLDDYHNIIKNPSLHLETLSYESIIKTFHASYDSGQYLGNRIFRPIPCFTFALNWYFDKNNVVGYHIVNIFFHLITSFFLYFTVLNLLKAPNLKDKYKGNEQFLALLSATLWAINPIQVQAVTYIVQRMAAMAAMFYILSILLYIKARIETSKKKRIIFFLLCSISFLGGIASKENAALIPLSLMLIELIFFQDINRPEIKKYLLYISLLCLALIIIYSAFFYKKYNNPFTVLDYSNRPFTLMERLLTEPRIVIYYLSQIFYPVPTRLSIEHNVIISTSILHPWNTLPSIILIILFTLFGFTHTQKYPILSFAILFFLLNHSIESTFIGLELFFEHRNYLPSFFLFLPVAIGFKRLIDFYYNQNRFMYIILVSFIIIFLSGIGMSTYIRNMAWASEKTLWEDALKKAPNSTRAHHNLAWAHYERIKNYDKAMELYKKSLTLQKHNVTGKPWALNNIANLYFIQKDYKNAAKIWDDTFRMTKGFDLVRYRLALVTAKNGEIENALNLINPLIEKQPNNLKALNLKGLLLLRQEKPENAISFFRKCLKIKRNEKTALLNTGIACYFLKDYERAEYFLESALEFKKNDFLTILWLIETNLETGDKENADKYIDTLLDITNINNLVITMNEVFQKHFLPPVPGHDTIMAVSNKLSEISKDIKELQNFNRTAQQ